MVQITMLAITVSTLPTLIYHFLHEGTACHECMPNAMFQISILTAYRILHAYISAFTCFYGDGFDFSILLAWTIAYDIDPLVLVSVAASR